MTACAAVLGRAPGPERARVSSPFRSESSAATRVDDVRKTLRELATHGAGFDPASIEVLSLGRAEIGIDFPPGN